MGAGQSIRPSAHRHGAVVVQQLNDEPRRVGCASFLRSEGFGTRRTAISEDVWIVSTKSQPSAYHPDAYRRSQNVETAGSTSTCSKGKNHLVRVKASLKTALLQGKKAPPSSMAPERDVGANCHSMNSLSTVAETNGNCRRAEPCARPHSVAERRCPSGSFPHRRVNSVGSLQYTVRHSEPNAVASQSRCSSTVSCASLISSESSSRTVNRGSCSGSCSSLARTTRPRGLTSSTSSQADSGVFSMASSRRSSSGSASSRCVSRCSADRLANSPSPLCRSGRTPRISELLTAFARAVCHECPVARREDVESWVKAVDRALIHSGWQEQPFLCTANAVLVFAVFREAIRSENIRTTADLRGVILTCLYVAYSYGGHEISYPLKPFLYSTDRALFWDRCMRIACASSKIMLQLNLHSQCYQELSGELLEFLPNCY